MSILISNSTNNTQSDDFSFVSRSVSLDTDKAKIEFQIDRFEETETACLKIADCEKLQTAEDLLSFVNDFLTGDGCEITLHEIAYSYNLNQIFNQLYSITPQGSIPCEPKNGKKRGSMGIGAD